ncbi:hypothetical protein [Oceanicaulis alexandrii]|uniref:hypothetical protein n=1 Tax=Oceanicaulis alexandrii TaxID=153233 RepID=UPI003B501D3C
MIGHGRIEKTGPAQKAKKRRAAPPWTPSYPFETDRSVRFNPHRRDSVEHRYDAEFDEL